DAITGHGDDAAGATQFFNNDAFALRQYFRFDVADAEFGRDGARGGAGVSGEHDDDDALRPQRIEGCLRCGFERIGDGNEPGERAVYGDKYDRSAVVAQTL